MVDVIGMGNAIVDITAAAAEVSSLIEFHDACKGGFFRTTPEAFAIIKRTFLLRRFGGQFA